MANITTQERGSIMDINLFWGLVIVTVSLLGLVGIAAGNDMKHAAVNEKLPK